MRLELYKHQKKLLIINPNKYLIAWECGTGKTLMGIELAKKNNQKALVVCPKSLVDQWIPQVPKNWLVLSKENFKKHSPELPKYNLLIIDEAHYFSNFKSQLTKSLLLYIKNYNPEYIYLLTATPYLSTSWNIYTYGLIFGRDWKWFDWNKTFFNKIKMGNRMIPIEKKKINNIPFNTVMKSLVNKLGGTIAMEECFDIPEQVYQEETFSLTKEQKDAIDNIKSVVDHLNQMATSRMLFIRVRN